MLKRNPNLRSLTKTLDENIAFITEIVNNNKELTAAELLHKVMTESKGNINPRLAVSIIEAEEAEAYIKELDERKNNG